MDNHEQVGNKGFLLIGVPNIRRIISIVNPNLQFQHNQVITIMIIWVQLLRLRELIQKYKHTALS